MCCSEEILRDPQPHQLNLNRLLLFNSLLLHETRSSPYAAQQVFDLEEPECRPATVLRKLWANMDAAIAAGDMRGAYFKRSLRVLAAGGDGTVAWILSTIRQVMLTITRSLPGRPSLMR